MPQMRSNPGRRDGLTAITSVLWTALAAAFTLAILSDFSWPALMLFGFVFMILAIWLAKHQTELHAKYKEAEAAAAVPGPFDKQIWRHRPTVRDLAPALSILGLCSLYFAYTAAHGDAPTKVAKLIHQYFGVPRVVAFWSLLGSIMLAKATESFIGSRIKK